MILDEDTTRLLISEALKDKLNIDYPTTENSTVESNDSMSIDIYIRTKDEALSIGGPLLDLEKDLNGSVEATFNASIPDAYEIFNILSSDCECVKYSLSLLEKNSEIEGSFTVNLKKMTNFDYKNNQCTLCIELINSDQ